MFMSKQHQFATAQVSLLIIATLTTVQPLQTKAENQTNGISPEMPIKKRLKNSENPEFKAERLKKPIELVAMPPYGGKKVEFVVGTLFARVKGGPSVTMQFSTADKPKDVLDWYRNAFAQYQWTPLQNMTGLNGLAAERQHNIVQVMTLAPTRHGAKCDVLVRYKFFKADS